MPRSIVTWSVFCSPGLPKFIVEVTVPAKLAVAVVKVLGVTGVVVRTGRVDCRVTTVGGTVGGGITGCGGCWATMVGVAA